MTTFQAPTGTRDILAPESARFEHLVGLFCSLARVHGYDLVVSPMFEDVGVFRRAVGESSEVVTKEMYEFQDKGGRTLALRPEGTASIVRAYIQHRPALPFKSWYLTPAFRYERPQAGRYRQHHQFGVEALGSDDPDLDVEVIALLSSYLAKAGLTRLELKVNSMGDDNCLPAYKEALARFLAEEAADLCAEHEKSYEQNPLRVLDCKRPQCSAVKARAPRLSDALCEPCAKHFARVLDGLDALGIAWKRDEFLVRGLDYYTRTTFEFAALGLDSAQNAVGGGGRYDRLCEALGGPPTPGIGFGSGVERVLLAQLAEGQPAELDRQIEVFVVDLTGGGAARDLTFALRAEHIGAERAFDGRSLKAQLRQADRSGARLAVIVGPEELEKGVATIKDLRHDKDASQQQIPIGELVSSVKMRLA